MKIGNFSCSGTRSQGQIVTISKMSFFGLERFEKLRRYRILAFWGNFRKICLDLSGLTDFWSR